jgi:RNA polymerase sigma-70 factor (ECF subfamily)
MTEPEHPAGVAHGSRRFPTTRWTVVRAAGGTASPDARAALESLCETYWSPVHAFVRRSGRSEDEASDITQAFFTRVIEKGDFGNARDTLGRFRTFLLTAVRHFLSNHADFERAARRGGGHVHVPLGPSSDEEARPVPDPASDETPESIFEQRWALTVIDTAMARLEREGAGADNGRLFETLRPFLTGDEGASYADAAQVLQKAEGTVRVAVHRLRRRFGQCLRETLADTVDDPADVAAELSYLLDVLARRHRASSLNQP